MKVQVRLSVALSVVALVAALCGVGGAYAGSVLVTSKQIKNGTIVTQDIHKGGVKSSDVANGTIASPDIGNGDVSTADIGTGQVQTADIGEGQVQPQDVTMPEPEQVVEGDIAKAEVGTESFGLIDTVGTYAKEDGAAQLQVDWSGSAAADPQGACIFQVRVDGQAAANGAGQVYLGPSAVISVSTSALFDGLAVGPHTVEVWAMIGSNHNPSGGPFSCTVGPLTAGVSQTFVVSEQVS